MQLPRGTFLTIKRSTKSGDLFSELHEMKFTGVCTISYKTGKGTIVFKQGKRILAEFQNTIGDSAWDAFQKIISEKADASLSTLSEAQIQLSLEFNKTCLVATGGKTEKPAPVGILVPSRNTTFPPNVTPPQQAKTVPVKIQQKPGIPQFAPLPGPGTAQQVKSPQPPRIISDSQLRTATQLAEGCIKTPVPPLNEVEKTPYLSRDQEESESSSFEADIETFETMDVEAIRDKIHGECKSLIKKLNLEHLTENQTESKKR
jgi:hypothetical protein